MNKTFFVLGLLVLLGAVATAASMLLWPRATPEPGSTADAWTRERVKSLEQQLAELSGKVDELAVLVNRPVVVPDARPIASPAESTASGALAAVDGEPPRAVQGRQSGPAARWLARLVPDKFSNLTDAELFFLRSLDLGGKQLSDQDLAQIGQMQHLVDLELGHNALGDAGLAYLGNLAQLQHLGLSKTDVTAAGIRQLPTTSLKSLHLNEAALHDEDLSCLQVFPALESVKLNRISISDHGMSVLGSCPSLRHIELDGTDVTAAGVEQLLRLNPELRRIEVRKTKITAEDVERIKARFPKVDIAVSSGASEELLLLQHLQTLSHNR